MVMLQVSNEARFITELFHLLLGEVVCQYLDGGLSSKINMFTEVDFSKTTFSQ